MKLFSHLVLFALPMVSGKPSLDTSHLLQRKLQLHQPLDISERKGVKSITCEQVQWTWYATAANIYLANAEVWGTNIMILSEGLSYLFVFHPGSDKMRIPGVHNHLRMGFRPKIGSWSKFTLLMHISGNHTLTIQGRDHYNNSMMSWSKTILIPNWFEGNAENVRFYARRGRYPRMDYDELQYGNLFGWRSMEGNHYVFFASQYVCKTELIERENLAPEILNTFQYCASWGDPHIKGWGFYPKIDFMGIGAYTQAKSVARSMETHTYQCPYAGGTSIAVGIAVRSGPHYISFISGITRVNGSIYTDGAYSLSLGTNVEISDNYVEIFGPTTLTGYGKISARAWIRPDSPTGYIVRAAVSMPLASTQYAEGECAHPPSFTEVPPNDTYFTVGELLELDTVCQPPDGWQEATDLDAADVCGSCPPPMWLPSDHTLHSFGMMLCSTLLTQPDLVEACALDFCVSCGDTGMPYLTVDGGTSTNNVTVPPSNIGDPIEEANVSPNIPMAHCMLWGSGSVLNFEEENYTTTSDEGSVVEMVESNADDTQVQVRNCATANFTVGAAPVAVAVRMGPNVIIVNGTHVTVNGTGYDFGEHNLPGHVKIDNQNGLIEVRGTPKMLGIPRVIIRTFNGSRVSVAVRLPASTVGYSTGVCRVNSLDQQPGTSLFDPAQGCPALVTADPEDVADEYGIANTADVTPEMVCNYCADHGFTVVTDPYQAAEDVCAMLLNTPFYDPCINDVCNSCGHGNPEAASEDSYVRNVEDGDGIGTWPADTAERMRVLGDPHAQNMKGESFDIHSTGLVQLVRIPREAEPIRAELLITADLVPVANSSCAPTFIHKLNINGSRMGGAPLTLKIGPGGTPQVISTRSGFKEARRGPRRELQRGDITIATFNNSAYPASKGLMHVTIGKYNLAVRQAKQDRHEFLNVDIQGILGITHKNIGGLLGLDSHDAEAQVPEDCRQTPATALQRQEAMSQQKTLGEEEGMVFNAKMMSTVNLF